jgi:hypothetical protein
MNIVCNLRAYRHISSMYMTRGFRCCMNAIGMPPLLAYLARVLDRVFLVTFNRQQRIKMLKIKGACRECR